MKYVENICSTKKSNQYAEIINNKLMMKISHHKVALPVPDVPGTSSSSQSSI